MVMERRDQFCKDLFGEGLMALFDRKKDQEGKLWRCFRSVTLKEVSFLRGFAYDEVQLQSGLFSRHSELVAIRDDL